MRSKGLGRSLKTTKRYGEKADLALTLWVKLARAAATFGRHADKDIERYGLTQPQFSLLEILGHLGPMTIGEASKKMLVTGGCMTVIVDNLEREGLVERIRISEDRRVIKLGLTARGTKLFEKIFPKHAQVVERLASVLSTDEQTQLAHLLKKLGLALKEAR